jgi:AcrR family transcriptional regulator
MSKNGIEPIMNTSPVNRFERRKQRTRNQLKQSAIELILEKGYDAVSVQDITNHADLGRGTFYVHFDDKEDIVWKALREGFDALNDDLNTRYANEHSPRLEYLIWIRIFEYAAEHRNLFLVMLGGKGSALLKDRIEDYLIEVAEQGIKQGRYYPGFKLSPTVMAQFLVGALVRLLKWWLETPNDYSPEEMADQLYEMIFRGKPPTITNGA